MDPAARFAALVSGPPTALSLDRACSLLAAGFTGVDRTDEVVARLDELAGLVAEPTLRGVLAVMRGRVTGNIDDYYDPRNSYLDEVLRRGVGLPITLSVAAMEIGRRVGASVVGVGVPSHFLVRDAQHDVYGDPFHEGAVMDRAALVAAWPRLVGEGTPFDELHLVPVSERVILIRMLNNLRALFGGGGEPRALYALAVMRGGFAELAHEAPQHARWVRHYN
jgi:regulator of sirC expression with transglutaminase-like and TPR domain